MLNAPQYVDRISLSSGANSVGQICDNVTINALEVNKSESTSQNKKTIDTILSDNATAFRGKVRQKAMAENNVRVTHCSAYFASGNPTERILHGITIFLRILCHKKHSGWFDKYRIIEDILNKTPHGVTKIAPEKLFTGKEPAQLFVGLPNTVNVPTNEEVDECKKTYLRLVEKAEKRKKVAKRYRHKWNLQVGELVWVRDKHLGSMLKGKYFRMGLLYKGPVRISKILGDHTCEVANLESNKPESRVHKQLLRKYKGVRQE